MIKDNKPNKVAGIPPQHLKLANAAVKIRQDHPRDVDEMGYMSKSLISASLPYTDPGPIELWTRSNGNHTLYITPGYHKEDELITNLGIPYGSIPRLIIIWACTEIKIKKSPELHLGKSFNAFLTMLKLDDSTKARARAQKQIISLFGSSISWDETIKTPSDNINIRHNLPLMNNWAIWTDPVNQTMKWNSTITVSNDFFTEITKNFFPVDLRAVHALKNSPVALDLYMWLTRRVYSIKTPTPIPWTELYKQLGADVKELRLFKRHIINRLTNVKVVYPDLNYDIDNKALILKPSRTSVPMTWKI